MAEKIQNYIEENLSGEIKQTALDFVGYLEQKGLTFYKDNSDCWKNKIYYWAKYNDACVCFIAVKDPDEPDNLWTVWSDDSAVYANPSVRDEIKNIGWQNVDYCSNCGVCGGGKEKVVFGRRFLRVCRCTFRIDNAVQKDLPFLKAIVALRLKEF